MVRSRTMGQNVLMRRAAPRHMTAGGSAPSTTPPRFNRAWAAAGAFEATIALARQERFFIAGNAAAAARQLRSMGFVTVAQRRITVPGN